MTSSPEPATLARVRGLLAKAESTDYPEEAEALTAKAQELMARHAIDVAVLGAVASGPSSPTGRRVPLERPYARERFHLLSRVADANRCRAIWDREAGDGIVVGFPADQESVEILYTSLLVQATTTMVAAGTTAQQRTRRYRMSFLLAFATRIGERLAAAQAAATTAAEREHGGDLAPVLVSRADAVDRYVDDEFPDLRTTRAVIRDRAGLQAGRRAADRASLGGRPLHRTRRQLGRVRRAAGGRERS